MFRAHRNMTVEQFKLSMGLTGTLYAPRRGALDDNRTLGNYDIDGSFAVYLDEDKDAWQPPVGSVEEFDFDYVKGDEVYLVPVEIGLTLARRKQHTRQKKERSLDGYALLTSCGVDLPEECCKAVLSNVHPPYTSVALDHMREFVNLTFLELSGNRLQLEDLETLPALEELRIACNQMEYIKLSESPRTGRSDASRPSSPPNLNPFPFLNVLDLGFNFLEPSSVLELACIPNLLDLNLSSNDLLFLPRDLSGFRNLRRLSLRGNKLGEGYTVTPEDVHTVQERRQLQEFSLESGLESDTKSKGEEEKLFPAYTRVGKRDAACLRALASIPKLEELDMGENFLLTMHGGTVADDPKRAFSKLKFLALTMNAFDSSQRLLPTAEFPSLEWIDARGNPFNEIVLWNKTWDVLYPECYQQLTLAKGVCIVFADPKPSVSFLDHDGHIMKPPAVAPPKGITLKPAKQLGVASASSSAPTASLESNRGSSSSIHNRLQLRNLANPSQSARERANGGDNTFLTTVDMMDDPAAQPDPMAEAITDERNVANESDGDFDSARSIVNENFTGKFDPRALIRLFDADANPAEFDEEKLLKGRHSAVAKKAARALQNILDNPTHGAPKREKDLPRYARPTHQAQKKSVPRVARRRDYTVNSTINQRSRRRPKVAQVYVDMANVLDAIDDSAVGDYADTPLDSARSDASVYDREHERSVRNARRRRAKIQERSAVESLLGAVQTKLLHQVI